MKAHRPNCRSYSRTHRPGPRAPRDSSHTSGVLPEGFASLRPRGGQPVTCGQGREPTSQAASRLNRSPALFGVTGLRFSRWR